MKSVSPEAFQAVQKIRVSEEIIDQVRDLIVSGRLQPGDRLPAERELARTFRVGRSAVREAIRAMESLGIVEARAGEGTFVATLPESHGRDPITATLFQAWSAQRKLFEVRRLLEPGLAALAARRATAEQVEKLRGVLGEQEVQVQRGETGVMQDTMFHFLIAEATGNEVLLRIVENLMDLLRKTRETSLQHGDRPARSLKQHRAILSAIEARDPAAAERRMRDHIRAIEKLAFSSVKGPPAEPASARPSTDHSVVP
ncbi:MAG: FadR family transcriptional regulator [candidate division NC10 bacterium]|nr:FadR family transcriptional regulator [candidate division NC10 bacterium]